MTLKAELLVFPEGGIDPPEPKNRNTPPLADKFWQIPPGNFGHSRCLLVVIDNVFYIGLSQAGEPLFVISAVNFVGQLFGVIECLVI